MIEEIENTPVNPLHLQILTTKEILIKPLWEKNIKPKQNHPIAEKYFPSISSNIITTIQPDFAI